MCTPVKSDGDELIVGGTTISFPADVFDVLEIDDTFVVLLEWVETDHPDKHRNVYAVDPDGSIRWQIDECPDVTGGGHDVYSGLYDHEGELWVTNLNGMKYKVDQDDGRILEKKFVK